MCTLGQTHLSCACGDGRFVGGRNVCSTLPGSARRAPLRVHSCSPPRPLGVVAQQGYGQVQRLARAQPSPCSRSRPAGVGGVGHCRCHRDATLPAQATTAASHPQRHLMDVDTVPPFSKNCLLAKNPPGLEGAACRCTSYPRRTEGRGLSSSSWAALSTVLCAMRATRSARQNVVDSHAGRGEPGPCVIVLCHESLSSEQEAYSNSKREACQERYEIGPRTSRRALSLELGQQVRRALRVVRESHVPRPSPETTLHPKSWRRIPPAERGRQKAMKRSGRTAIHLPI